MSYVYDPHEAREKLITLQAKELLSAIKDALDDGLQPEQIRAMLQCRSRDFYEFAGWLGAAEAAAASHTACGNLSANDGAGGCERVGLLRNCQDKVVMICALLNQIVSRVETNQNGDYMIIDRNNVNQRN